MKPINVLSRHPRHLLAGLLVLGAIGIVPGPDGFHRRGGIQLQAEEFTQDFEDPQPSWTPHAQRPVVRLRSQSRQGRVVYSGEAAEIISFQAAQGGGLIQLEHDLPPARVFNDLKLSLWVRSNRREAALFLRIVFPRQKDPSTGKTLVTFVRGDRYSELGQWQRLECTTRDKHIRERLVLLRARLDEPNLDTDNMYVDQAILTTRLKPGTAEFYLDELRFGPVVPPQLDEDAGPRKDQNNEIASPVEFRLDRLQVNGRPFFPRLAAYHGESLTALKETGVNVVWIPDVDDDELLSGLKQEGLWATAIPPRAVSANGEVLDAQEAGIVPFSQETTPILMWYLGTRIPPGEKNDLFAWCEQIRNADFRFERPIMADVTGAERMYSRQLEMLGVSRHVLGTSFSLKQYRDWLIEKRKLAQRGSFLWTWIQTEAVSAKTESRRAARSRPIVVEPEQIRLQLYAALAAGCRGVGYWKTTSFDDNVPGAYERRLAITQLNLELELLERWLAGGTFMGQVGFDVNPRPRQEMAQHGPSIPEIRAQSAGRSGDDRPSATGRSSRAHPELEAAMIRGNRGTLLLPVWYQRAAQFVPGQMAANNATIVVPGVDESASAWEITTTGIRSLTRKRVTGGVQVTLPKFNQTAAVLLTADRTLIAELREQVEQTARSSARVSLDLAKAKLVRVRQVDEELQALGVGQPDAPQLLAKAEFFVDLGERTYERGDYHRARQLSRNALQLMRILQRAHWSYAVRNMSHPASSPHTVCFQTLPDHWRMVARLGRSQSNGNKNLLRSGDFEDIDTMIAESWQHTQNTVPGVRAAAELYPVAREGRYSLRLIAVPDTGEEPPTVIRRNPVTVTSPPVTVRSGQIVHISGWVKVRTPVTGSLDGALLYDNFTGPIGGLRFDERTGWHRFAVLREVPHSGEMTLTLALTGLGEVLFDDLRLIPHTPPLEADSAEAAEQSPDTEKSRGNALDFLNRLPRFNPLAPDR